MQEVPLAIGIVLIIATIIEALWTTVWADKGAGLFSSFYSRWIWRACLPPSELPRQFDLTVLDGFGVPIVSPQEFSDANTQYSQRRRALLQLVRTENWDWFDGY